MICEMSLPGRANARGTYTLDSLSRNEVENVSSFRHSKQLHARRASLARYANGSWRNDLAGTPLCQQVCRHPAPYIKYDEAALFCKLLHSGIEVITLVNINVEAVSASALDLAALRCLAEAMCPPPRSSSHCQEPRSTRKCLSPTKRRRSVVTSGNLVTRSALDSNLEYGVLLRSETGLVQCGT